MPARRSPAAPRTVSRQRPATPSVVAEAPPVSRSAEVVLDVEVDRGRVHLVLANCGDAVATDIAVEFSRDLRGIDGALDISALPVFRRLGVLRPGRALRIFWDAVPALFARRDQASPFVATVSWSERSGLRQQAEYHHDPSIYRQLPECIEPDP